MELRVRRLGFESLRARPGQRPLLLARRQAFVLTDLLTKDPVPTGKTG
jgi:hypothetical protein